MSNEERILPAAWTDQIDEYLDRVEATLLSAGANRSSRRSVTEMVEDQIAEMCQTKLNDESTDEDFQHVFSKLDRPENYAQEFGSSPVPVAAESKPGFSKLAILAGGLLLLSGAALLSACLSLEDGPDFVTIHESFERFLTICVCLAILAPPVGWYALRRIESTDAKLRGRRIAKFAFFLPLIGLGNAMVVYIAAGLPSLVFAIGIASTLVCFNPYLYRMIRSSMERASKPRTESKNGEFGMPAAAVQ